MVLALTDVLGPKGTLVVPAQTPENRDPQRWNPPVSPQWWPAIREHLPGFHAQLSPTAMGAVAERVRTWPGAARSEHPQTSFAAFGPLAAELMAGHDLDCQLGDRSPLGRLAGVGARVLLLGVGYDKCTAFHLAEYRLPHLTRCEHRRSYRSVVFGPHGPQWVTYEDLTLDDSGFDELGQQPFGDQRGLQRPFLVVMRRVRSAAIMVSPQTMACRRTIRVRSRRASAAKMSRPASTRA